MQKISQQSQKQPNRRSVRFREYDYSGDGSYFITICTKGRRSLFGTIVDGKMNLNKYGQIVSDEWKKTAILRHYVKLDNFIVMPNHFHGIIVLCRGTACRAQNKERICDEGIACQGTARRAPTGSQFGESIVGSIPTIVRAFKSATTKCINEIRNRQGMKLWQRNYYEHIIRDEYDHYYVCEYIQNNPINWAQDCNYVKL